MGNFDVKCVGVNGKKEFFPLIIAKLRIFFYTLEYKHGYLSLLNNY